MRRRDDNQEIRENTGKMSKLAKSVMAADLAVGGAAAFGDMNVFAAENDDSNPEVSVDTQAQSDVEQHSAEIDTGAVSVTTTQETSEPVTNTTENGGTTTTETTTTTKDTYYVDPSTIGDYDNVNEQPGEDRTHLFDRETTTTTTTTTTETSSEEDVDVSDRKNDAVEDIAREVAADTDKDGSYVGSSETTTSEDGNTTTVTETGSVTDTESTFDGNTTTTTTTTSEVTKTTTTETKKDFTNADDAKEWGKKDGFSLIGDPKQNRGPEQTTQKKDYETEKDAIEGAKKENPNASNIEAKPGETIKKTGDVKDKNSADEAWKAAKDEAKRNGIENPEIEKPEKEIKGSVSGTVYGKNIKEVED